MKNDTPPETERRFRSMMLARSGAERLAMASGMFESARAIVLASLPDNLPDCDTRQLLRARIYPELGERASGNTA